MISPDATPIAHHPPRPPIDLRPTYSAPESEPATYWEMAYAESLRLERRLRADRLWAIVVEFARGMGVIPQPVASERASGPLIESEGHSEGGWSAAFEFIRSSGEFVDGLAAELLEDGRNTTEELSHVGVSDGWKGANDDQG